MLSIRPAARALRTAFLLLVALTAGPTACHGQDADVAQLERMRDELLPRIEQVTGLAPRAEIRLERRDRATLREYIRQRMADELPPGELEGIRATYAQLGLVPDTLDLERLFLELYTEQVVGYYDPQRKTLYVMEGVPAREAEGVLSHELVHALQDQYVELDSLIARERGNDRQTAAQAAIEGHATLAMVLLAFPGAAPDPAMLPDMGQQLRSALESENSRFPVFRSAPPIIRELLLFPYLGGAGFVQRVWRARPAGGALPDFRTLIPESTEQVLHPERAFLEAPDLPTDVVLGASPEGWRDVYANGLGELETRILLRERGGAAAEHAASGWDGDAYRLLADAEGHRVLVWYSVWDDAAAADGFAAQLEQVLRDDVTRHARVERLRLQQRELVHAVIAERALPLERAPRIPATLR